MFKRVLIVVLACATYSVSVANAQSELPPQCQRLLSLDDDIIYKGCAGSGHLSTDPRGAGIALIAKKHVRFRPDRCMRMYKLDGTQIAALYLYPFNDPRAYAWRGYSNYISGCGRGDTRKKVRNRVTSTEDVFIQVKKRNKTCVRLSRMYQNVNSVQRCDRS